MEEIDESDWLIQLEDIEHSKEGNFPQVKSATHENAANKLISNLYSGPTIGDIENALSSGYYNNRVESLGRNQAIVLAPEKGRNKNIDNRYILKIKSCKSGGVSDDGYKWRKYGQKSIKNSPNPRSYYRCTNSLCNAKKQVERSIEDPETLIVTYEGLHLHYTYSHFLFPRPENRNLHLPKKPKIQNNDDNNKSVKKVNIIEGSKQEEVLTKHSHDQEKRQDMENGAQEEFLTESTNSAPDISNKNTKYDLILEEEQRPQGLLEDIVPLLVRKPCGSNASSDEATTPPSLVSSPSYSTSIPWSPAGFYFDVDVLSSIF